MGDSKMLPLSDLSNDELFNRAMRAMEEDLLDHALNMSMIIKQRLDLGANPGPMENELQSLISELKSKIRLNKKLDIVIVGDSLSLPRPNNLKEYDATVNPFLSTHYHDTYPVVVENTLKRCMPECEVRVTNLSKRSHTILDVVDMRHDIFCWYNPDVIVFQVGLVDCFPRGEILDQQNVSISDFEKYLCLIINFHVQSCPTKKCIFVGISPTDNNMSDRYPMFPKLIDSYNQVIRSLCEKAENIFYLDMHKLFDKDSPYDLLHYDGQHLSTHGHYRVANFLAKMISSEIDLFGC